MLWDTQQLSNSAKKAIMNRFVTFELVEEFPHGLTLSPAYRELKLIVHTDFPFPKSAWVEVYTDIAIGRDPSLSDSSLSGVYSLGDRPRHFGSLAELYPGHPVASAVIQLREVNYTKGHSKTFWSIRKKVKPITLADKV